MYLKIFIKICKKNKKPTSYDYNKEKLNKNKLKIYKT